MSIKWGLCSHPSRGVIVLKLKGERLRPKDPQINRVTTLFLLNGLNRIHLLKLEVTEFLWGALCLFLSRTCINVQITVFSPSCHLLCAIQTYKDLGHRETHTCEHKALSQIHTRSVCTLISSPAHLLTCLYFGYPQPLQVTNYLLKFNHKLVYFKNIMLKLL